MYIGSFLSSVLVYDQKLSGFKYDKLYQYQELQIKLLLFLHSQLMINNSMIFLL